MKRGFGSLVRFIVLLTFVVEVVLAAEAPSHGTSLVKRIHRQANHERDKASGASSTQPKSEAYRPIPPAGSFEENDAIRGHAARNWKLLTYPGKTIPSQAMTRARQWILKNVPNSDPWPIDHPPLGKQASSFSPAIESVTQPGSGSWVAFGPTPLDSSGTVNGYRYGTVSGRVNAIASDPNNASVAYMGATSGGLWKSTNIGSASVTWTPLWESQDVVTQAVGAIKIDPANSNIVYVGTGDFDAADQFGEGIMKSTDAGLTWTQLAASIFTPYAAGTPLWANQNIGEIEIDPNNSSNIYVGTRFDLYASTDAGSNWARCSFGANPTDPTNAANPIKSINRISGILLQDVGASANIYVAVGHHSATYNGDNGVYKGSIPAGGGCPALTLMNSGWPAGTGNGTNGGSSVGRIRLAASQSTGNYVIYAQVQNTTGTNALGTYVTTNQGTSWVQLSGSTDINYKGCTGTATNENQDWYDLFIAADPANDKTLYIGRINSYKATVNGTYSSMTITNLTNVYGQTCPEYGKVHPDQHAFTFVGTTGSTFLQGNDGGIYYNDASGAVGGWKQINDAVNTIQFYAGQISANFAGGGTQYTFGGAQDNGNSSWDSGTSDYHWIGRGNGGDGFFTSFDPIAGTLNAGRWYTEYTYGAMSCSSTGAAGSYTNCAPSWGASEREDWSTPFLLDNQHCTTTNCSNIVTGGNFVYVSAINGAPSWVKTGTTDLTKGTSTAGTIVSVNWAPSDPRTAIIGTFDGNVQWASNVFTGTNCTQAASGTASFACTGNTATTWVNLTQANAILPNRAILGVAIAPNTPQTVYVAVGGFDENTSSTPGHLYQATCSGSCNTASNWLWVNKSGNLPDVPAESVVVHPTIPNMVFIGTDAGFFYTKDITVASPLWERYEWGLPNTVIKFLTIDRGTTANPSTTLAAFTYGRGLYAINLPSSSGFCTHPGDPTNLATSVPGTNQIELTWTASSPAASSYNIYRTIGSCPGSSYSLLASGVTATNYTDSTVSGGTTYAYKVVGVGATSDCTSHDSNCSSALATGACTLPPDFAGLTSVINPQSATCSLNLSWSAATTTCGAGITYNVYRSTSSSFTPSVGNRIATGVSATTYGDTAGLISGTLYYYIVRAVGTANGAEDTNTIRVSGKPTGANANGTWTAGAEPGDPTMTMNSPWSTSSTTKHSGTAAYASGYSNSMCAALVTPSIALTGAQTSVLTYWIAYNTEPRYDGGVVEISSNGGSSWTILTPTPGYPNTFRNSSDACGYATNQPCYSGTNLTFTQATISLGAYNGSTVLIRWNLSSDAAVTAQGLYVDDISITNAQVPGACTTMAPEVSDDMTHWLKVLKNGSDVDIQFEDVSASAYNVYVSNSPNTHSFQVSSSASGKRTCGTSNVSIGSGMRQTSNYNPDSGISGSTSVLYFIISADNGPTTEGSLGKDSSLVDRTADSYCNR
jgi:hypothetical protein